MKINVKEAKVTSNVPQENVTAMSISVDGMEHIMTLLTNLYKDPELAVIREYYTNALDAHKAAGVEKKVLVTLPTWSDPTYRVQDFGIGMSVDDIKNIYAQYGASTKRDTNEQLGAFGLGCKSALTITQQFTLVSIKDGFKTTALISKSESGVNTVNIINSVPTQDGNGTTVQIPIKSRLHDFNWKAENFFKFSPKDSVLVDGNAPSSALEDAQKVEDENKPEFEVYLKPKGDGESYLIMGPVPYALSQAEIESSLKRLSKDPSRAFVRMPKYFVVPIGSVDLTPSREGLRFTDKTNEVIDAHMSFLLDDLKSVAIKELDTANDINEFFKLHSKWNNIIPVPQQFKGEDVPKELILDKDVRIIDRQTWGGSSHTTQAYIDLTKIYGKSWIVSGYSAEQYKKVNGYLTPYLNSLDLEYGKFYVTDDPKAFSDKWLKWNPNFTFISGDDIIEIGREYRKKERQAAAKSNPSGKKTTIHYPVFFVDEGMVRWVEHTDIEEDTPYLKSTELAGGMQEAILGCYRSMHSDRNFGTGVSEYFKSVTDKKKVILLNGSRTVKALEQRIPKTTSLIPEINKAVAKVEKLITDDVTKYVAFTNTTWNRFLTNSGINKHVKNLKDPDLVSILEPDNKGKKGYDEYNTIKNALNYLYNPEMPAVPGIDYSHTQSHIKKLDDKYPLAEAVHVWTLKNKGADHMVKYFNLIHEESLV